MQPPTTPAATVRRMARNHYVAHLRMDDDAGLHARPAAEIARVAMDSPSFVQVSHGSAQADGRSVLELMMLMATKDSELTVEVKGPDARSTLSKIIEVLAATGAASNQDHQSGSQSFVA